MGTNFEDPALEHLMYWVRENRKTADKIYKLIQDIHRNGPDKGIGQPERLRHFPGWSRRIDHGNRLVYQWTEKIYALSPVKAITKIDSCN